MSLLHQRSLSGKNVPNWVVILRLVLGICLVYKGIDFIQNKDQLISYFEQSKTLSNFIGFIAILPWVHIIGGLLIFLGLFTRLFSLIQVPILLGAIVFVNMTESAKGAQSELPFSFLMLVLVIVFFIEGGGFMSLDNYVRKPLNASSED